jgi:hypothetical protein
VSLAFVVRWGEVISLEQGCWSGGGGSAVLHRLHRWEAADLDPGQHRDVPRSTCHIDMCLAACNRLLHRLTKPHWWGCSLGSDNGGGSAFLPTCVSMTLASASIIIGNPWDRFVFFNLLRFICKVFKIIFLSRFAF